MMTEVIKDVMKNIVLWKRFMMDFLIKLFGNEHKDKCCKECAYFVKKSSRLNYGRCDHYDTPWQNNRVAPLEQACYVFVPIDKENE